MIHKLKSNDNYNGDQQNDTGYLEQPNRRRDLITWGQPAKEAIARVDYECPICREKDKTIFSWYRDNDGFSAYCYNCGWTC